MKKKWIYFLLGLSAIALLGAKVFKDNTLILGSGTASNKEIIFDKGLGASNPRIRWDETTDDLRFSNGGQNFKIGAQALGSIQQSILTEAEFQAEMGTTDWVLMDGRNIAGSKLATLKGWTTIPDARGRFLRTLGGTSAALSITQNDTTAVNGLLNASSTVTGTANISHDHPNTTSTTESANHSHDMSHDHTNSITSTNGSHTHEFDYNASSGNQVFPGYFTQGTNFYRNTGTTNVGGIGMRSAGSHDHTIDVNTYNGSTGSVSSNHTHNTDIPNFSGNGALTATAAAQVISGDAETRPDNLTVNTFIKIN